jgi:hypothetical protein
MIIHILLEAQGTEKAESYKPHSHINIPMIETKTNTILLVTTPSYKVTCIGVLCPSSGIS